MSALKNLFLFFNSIVNHGLTIHSVVTATEAPGGTTCSSGTEDLGEPIGKFVAVVAQETVASEVTFVILGTPLDALETQFTVPSRRAFSTPRTSTCSLALRWDGGLWVTYHRKENYQWCLRRSIWVLYVKTTIANYLFLTISSTLVICEVSRKSINWFFKGHLKMQVHLLRKYTSIWNCHFLHFKAD